MSELRIINRNGDTRLVWDGVDTEQALEAQRQFEALVNHSNTHWAYQVTSDGETVQTNKFDPTARQVIVTPRLVGG